MNFPRWLVIGVVIMVSLGWLVNLGAHLLYDRGDASVSLLFGLVLGALFGLSPAQVRRQFVDRMLGGGTTAADPEPDQPDEVDENDAEPEPATRRPDRPQRRGDTS